MKPYTNMNTYYDTCKCYGCRLYRQMNKEFSRAMKKSARRAGKKEIQDQLNEK